MLIKKIPPEIRKTEWETWKSPDIGALSSDQMKMVNTWAIINMLISNQKDIIYDYGRGKIFEFAAITGDTMRQKATINRAGYESYRGAGFFKDEAFAQSVNFPLHNYAPAVLEQMAQRHLWHSFQFRIAKDIDAWDSRHRDLIIPFNLPWYSDIRQKLYHQLRALPIAVRIPKNAVIYIGSMSTKVLENRTISLSWESELNAWIFNNFVFINPDSPKLVWPTLIASTDDNHLVRLEAFYENPYMPTPNHTKPMLPRYYVTGKIQLPDDDDPDPMINHYDEADDIIYHDTPVFISLGCVFRHMPTESRDHRAKHIHSAFLKFSIDPEESTTITPDGSFTSLQPNVRMRFKHRIVQEPLSKLSLEHYAFGSYLGDMI